MARDIALERQMHEDFTPWVAEHSRSTGIINDTGYDPLAFPPQRIDFATTPALIETGRVSPAEALFELENQYAKILGSYAMARAQIDRFLEARAFEDSAAPLAETVANYLEDGKNIGLITDHAEGLFDMSKGQAGLSLAVAKSRGPKHVGDFNAWVNKLMTRQTFGADTYVPELLSVAGGIRWVIPDTENGSRYITDQAVSTFVNRGALRSFVEDKKSADGTVEVMVPAGTRMTAKKDDSGKIEYLVAPSLPDSSANLLSHLDAIVVFSNWMGRISLSKVVEIDFKTKSERLDKTAELAAHIREVMRAQTQEVSGLPVVYAEELERASYTAV